MKKSLQKTIALALALIMIVAMTSIFASAEETETSAAGTETSAAESTASETAAETEPEAPAFEGRNVARDEGVSYTLARLVADPESDEEGASPFLSYLADDDYVLLTDGVTNDAAEIPKKSVGLAGTARSHRIKFDFGTEKTVNGIILLNMWNSYKSVDAQSGKPAGNRGYELDTMTVLTGDDELTMFKVETENTETDYEANARFHKVFLKLAEPATTRFLWIDIQTAQPGMYGTSDDMGSYIISLDEVEVYGDGAEAAPSASESEETGKTTEAEETNPNAVYDLEVSAPATAKAGDVIDVVISTKNIKSENGLMAVSFTLEYDTSKVTPNEVAPDPEKPEFYDKLMTKSPMYTMSFADAEQEVSMYENISRNYDGYYEFSFLDKISYPMQKEGTEADARLKNDGDLVITVPFTVKADVADGDKAIFTVKAVGGTDAGNADVQPFSIEGNGGKAIVVIGDEVPSETESQPAASETESQPAASETESQPAASETESQPAASESKPDDTPKTGDAGMIVFFAFAVLALAGVVVVKKTSK